MRKYTTLGRTLLVAATVAFTMPVGASAQGDPSFTKDVAPIL